MNLASASSSVLTVRQKVLFKDIKGLSSMQNANKSYLNDSTIIEDINDEDLEHPQQLTRTPSNINRQAKLQHQERILKQKRDISEKEKVVTGVNNGYLPKNINLYTNETQGVYGVYATQPDELDEKEVLKMMKPPTSKTPPSGASLVNKKIKSSNRLNPKRFNSIDLNDNVVNGLRLKQVTKDYSKDYTSSSEDLEKEAFTVPEDPPIALPSSPSTKSLMKTIFHNKETPKSKSVDFVERINDESEANDMMVAPASETSSQNEEEEEENETEVVDFSMFELLDKTSKKFCLHPATMGLTIRCQIFRLKGKFTIRCNHHKCLFH